MQATDAGVLVIRQATLLPLGRHEAGVLSQVEIEME